MALQFTRPRPSRCESGQILVLTTVSMIAVMGIMALSLDASFMFEKRNRLHAAADAAARLTRTTRPQRRAEPTPAGA